MRKNLVPDLLYWPFEARTIKDNKMTNSKKSPTGPTERTPKKSEYLMGTYLWVRGQGPIQIL